MTVIEVSCGFVMSLHRTKALHCLVVALGPLRGFLAVFLRSMMLARAVMGSVVGI
jgi:hypothetical protein